MSEERNGALLSCIIPAYNEEEMIPRTAAKLTEVLDGAGIPFELLFINDGSRDGTWAQILAAADADPRIHGICFSRNFGKESAMFAGLEKAAGDCCVVLDCDLQHPPEKIPEMYRLWQDGFDVVEGIKNTRGDETAFYRFSAGTFYRLISRTSGIDMEASSDFKLLDRKVVDTLNRMPERNVFFRALSYWVGFRKTEVSYDVQSRPAGNSKWSTRSLIRYALNNICSFSSWPLHLVTFLGVIALIIALVFSVETLSRVAMGNSLGGFPTVIILLLFMSSLIMISLGIIGFYIERIYEEVKGRPRYIISEYR